MLNFTDFNKTFKGLHMSRCCPKLNIVSMISCPEFHNFVTWTIIHSYVDSWRSSRFALTLSDAEPLDSVTLQCFVRVDPSRKCHQLRQDRSTRHRSPLKLKVEAAQCQTVHGPQLHHCDTWCPLTSSYVI